MAVPYPTALERHPVIRQSDLATFDNCALQSHFDLKMRKGWSSHPAAAGTLLHRVFRTCLVRMIENGEKEVPVDIALEVLEECYRQADVPLAAAGMEDSVVTVPTRWLAECRIIVKTWAANLIWDTDKIKLVEERLHSTISYPDGEGGLVERQFTGQPDVVLIDDVTATVPDWKTGWGIPSEGLKRSREDLASDGDNISDEGYFWQRSYGKLVFDRYPRVQRVVLREVYPRYLSGNATDAGGRPINPVRQATIDRYELPEIEAELSALMERFDRSIEASTNKKVGMKAFTPSPGTHCSYCPGITKCTIPSDARAEGRIESEEHAERVAAYLNVTRGASKQMTAALKVWTEEHGAIDVKNAKGKKKYGPIVKTRKVSPTREQILAAVRDGRDVESLWTEEEYVTTILHSPDKDEHPSVVAARVEEEIMLDMERMAAALPKDEK